MTNLSILIVCGVSAIILVAMVIIFMSRYKKCKPDELMIVYGKTAQKDENGNFIPGKVISGGATFVWPVFQGYTIMSMKSFDLNVVLEKGLSKQNIEVNLPCKVTLGISKDDNKKRNAAIRLGGLGENERNDQLKGIIQGQLRQVVSTLDIEELISNRDELKSRCMAAIATPLSELGVDIINITILDIDDAAGYIKNLGKKAAQEAASRAEAEIAEQVKKGKIGVAEQEKEQDVKTSEIQRDRNIQVANNEKEQAQKTADIEQERATKVAEAERTKEVNLRTIQKDQAIATAEQAAEEASTVAETKKQQAINVATAESEQAQKVAEQEKLRDVEIAKQSTETQTQKATLEAARDAEIAEKRAASKIAQEKASQNADASAIEFQKVAEARKETAKAQSEGKIREAEQEKASVIAEAEGKTRERKAKAEQDAKIAENNSGITVAQSDAKLGTERAKADETIGTASAVAKEKVGVAAAKADAEVAKARAAARFEEQQANIIVDAKIEAQKKTAEATGIKDKTILEAEGQAEAIIKKATAEAEGIRLKMLAEAEGKKALAEAHQVEVAAETAHLRSLTEAGADPAVAIAWVLRDQFAGIEEAGAKKFEHLNLGEVKVFGDSKQAGAFLGNIYQVIESAKTVGIPGLNGLFDKLKLFDNKQAARIADAGSPHPSQPEALNPEQPNSSPEGSASEK